MINNTMKYGTFKLISGEELISEYYVDEDNHIVLNRPVQIHRSNSPLGPILSVSHWMVFSESDSFKIKTDRIVALSPKIEDNALAHYKKFSVQRGNMVMDNVADEHKQEEFYSRLEAKMREMMEGDPDAEYLSNMEPDANTIIH